MAEYMPGEIWIGGRIADSRKQIDELVAFVKDWFGHS